MKKILLLVSFLAVLMFAFISSAEQRIFCGRHDIVYNEDGTVSVWRYDSEQVYDSIDDMFMDLLGYIPPKTIKESGYADLTSWNKGSSNNNNTSTKTRGRLIYTVQEATEITKDTGNTFRLRYK